MLTKRAPNQFEFCRAGERRSMFESVVTDGFDRVKHGQSAPAEQLNIDSQIRRYGLGEEQTSFEQLAGSLDQNTHETGKPAEG